MWLLLNLKNGFYANFYCVKINCTKGREVFVNDFAFRPGMPDFSRHKIPKWGENISASKSPNGQKMCCYIFQMVIPTIHLPTFSGHTCNTYTNMAFQILPKFGFLV
jgi:hypothetical protein